MEGQIDLVKVFSVTTSRNREVIGERVTNWMRENDAVRVTQAIVTQSSDNRFHCLTIVLFCEMSQA
jgi:hypothetical protein